MSNRIKIICEKELGGELIATLSEGVEIVSYPIKKIFLWNENKQSYF